MQANFSLFTNLRYSSQLSLHMHVLHMHVLLERLGKSHRIFRAVEHMSLRLSYACACLFHEPHYMCIFTREVQYNVPSLNKNAWIHSTYCPITICENICLSILNSSI